MGDTASSEMNPQGGFQAKLLSPAMLRELSARSDLQGFVRTASHYGVIAVLAALIWLVSSRYGAAWALPLTAVQGYFVAFLFMAVHETAHKTAFLNRTVNLAVGHLSGFAIGLPYEYYCLFHWDHHRHTQDPEKDPELLVGPVPTSDTHLAIAYSGLLQVAVRVRLMFRHALTGQVAAPWIPAHKSSMVVTEARLYVAGYALLLNAQRFPEHPHHLHCRVRQMVHVEHALSRRAPRLPLRPLPCTAAVEPHRRGRDRLPRPGLSCRHAGDLGLVPAKATGRLSRSARHRINR